MAQKYGVFFTRGIPFLSKMMPRGAGTPITLSLFDSEICLISVPCSIWSCQSLRNIIRNPMLIRRLMATIFSVSARSVCMWWPYEHPCGSIEQRPLADLLKHVDAAHVDLKGFDDETYRKLNSGKLQPILETLKLAKVKHVAPRPHFAAPRPVADFDTLKAIVACRYDVLAKYAYSLKRMYAVELRKMRRLAPEEARALKAVAPLLDSDDKMLHDVERARLAEVLPKSLALQTMVSMRRELAAVWGRSTATREQLVRQLQDWCRRAEASGIGPLVEFSQRLRSYA